ncbi:MAG: UDP-N-acetylglucosamine 2-epimerase (non-hydrolyzing) [Bacteroidetes bacterium]|nr:UDP-N-acetylglucosamine 2-epimerase (non-hydrolyzing) [Bacteroidota bacterium]
MKIISVVGARPQFIKLAPLSKEIRKLHNELIIHTGQHFDEDMSKYFFEQLEIPEPDYNLGIRGGNHGEQTGKMLIGLEEVVIKENPDLIIVFGDTNSTLTGSLVAAKLGIKSVHIEAGLRSFNRSMPEEINRIISDHTSDYLFAPTKTAIRNLENEGLSNNAYLTGDIMVDVLMNNIEKAKTNSQILNELNIVSNQYYLLTLHRPYNVDDPKILQKLLNLLSSIDTTIVFPVHPRTNKIITENNLNYSSKIRLIKPVGYLDFISLENNCAKIITDSGGVQKEAYILKKACITIRPETEWVETLEEGWNILISADQADFVEQAVNFNPSHAHRNVFGSNVAAKMVDQIEEILNS